MRLARGDLLKKPTMHTGQTGRLSRRHGMCNRLLLTLRTMHPNQLLKIRQALVLIVETFHNYDRLPR